MLIFILTSLVIFLLLLLISAIIIINRLMARLEIYEGWILDFKTDVTNVLEEMRDIDKSGVLSSRINEKGVFESDDLVGGVFKELLDVVEKLHQRTQ